MPHLRLKSIFSAAVLAGSVLMNGTAAARQQSGSAPMAAPEPSAPYTLYASDATKARLGNIREKIETLLPQWANADVLLITPADTTGFNGLKNEADVEAYKNRYGYAPQNDEQIAEFYIDRLLTQLPGFQRGLQLSANQRYDLMSRLFRDAQAGHLFMEDNKPGRRPAAIIVMSDPDGMPNHMPYERYLSALTATAPARFPAISSREWFVFFLIHEARHVANDLTNGRSWLKVLEDETLSDYAGLAGYARLPSLGLPYNEKLPDVLLALRALSALPFTTPCLKTDCVNGFANHVANISLDIDKDKVAVDDSYNSAQQATALLYVSNLSSALTASVLNHAAKAGKTAPLNIAPALLTDFTSSKRQDSARLQKAKTILDQNPMLQYAAIKILRDKGFFRQGTAEAVIAEEYIAAFETYVPSCKVDPQAAAFRNAAAKMRRPLHEAPVTPGQIDEARKTHLEALKSLDRIPNPVPWQP